ncbi:MAG: MerR family transcriptional regulator [Gaiellaceae bacterium]|jgi:DNA-binding transcriptional MerR regulator
MSDLYRIGKVAEQVGVTARTIRYYEELGLLGTGAARERGAHRLYTDADVARLRELISLRDLLGVSLEELKQLVEADEARALLRERWHATDSSEQRRLILEQGLTHIEAQLALVRNRQRALAQLARELVKKRQRMRARLRTLGGQDG